MKFLLPHEILLMIAKKSNKEVLHSKQRLDPKTASHLEYAQTQSAETLLVVGLWGCSALQLGQKRLAGNVRAQHPRLARPLAQSASALLWLVEEACKLQEHLRLEFYTLGYRASAGLQARWICLQC